jgi:glycosyltransferase involved in cell wall biosynthesis
MRITFVLPHANLAGGVRAVAMHAGLLAAMGHGVTVVSTPKKLPPLGRRVKDFVRGRGWTSGAGGPSHLDSVKNIRHHEIDKFRPVTDDDVPDADVIVATWWETAEWVAALSPSKGTKVYFIQHHEVVFDNQPVSRVKATYKLPMRKVVVAKWLAELMRDAYEDRADIRVVPCGIDHDVFNAPPRGKQKRPTVGMMYATAAFKGCDIALDAFKLAARNISHLQLHCFGEIEPTEALPLPSGGAEFELKPPQKRIAEIYASCDAWLFASRSEGFGLPVLEAMACRTPVIGTPTGVAPEALGEHDPVTAALGGTLVKFEDAKDMAIAIERIARLKETEWKAMSDAAYRAAHKYTWERSAKLMEAALLDAVANPAKERQRGAGVSPAGGSPASR